MSGSMVVLLDHDGSDQTVLTAAEACAWASEKMSCVDLSSVLKSHSVSRSPSGKLAIRKKTGQCLYFVPCADTVHNLFRMIAASRLKLSLVWVVRWEDDRLSLVPRKVALICPRMRRFEPGTSSLLEAAQA